MSLADFSAAIRKAVKYEDIVFDPESNVSFMPSGCILFDLTNGGGFPRGRLTEVFGMEHSGKTSLALATASELLGSDAEAKAIYWDFEHALDATYARNVFGLEGSDRFAVVQPHDIDDGDKAFDKIDMAGKVDLMVFDSVDAMRPRALIERSVSDSQLVGAHARAMSQFVSKVRRYCNATGCTAVFLNQMRSLIQSRMSGQHTGTAAGYNVMETHTTTGGYALRYYSSLRVKLDYGGQLKERVKLPSGKEAETRVANIINITNVKNKVFTPFFKAKATFRFPMPHQKGGWDNLRDTVQILRNMGLVTQKGPRFSYLGPTGWENVGSLDESSRLFSESASFTEAVGLARAEGSKGMESALSDGFDPESFDITETPPVGPDE